MKLDVDQLTKFIDDIFINVVVETFRLRSIG